MPTCFRIQDRPAPRAEAWTLKQVQGDGAAGGGRIRLPQRSMCPRFGG
jgi:hypothetical protein